MVIVIEKLFHKYWFTERIKNMGTENLKAASETLGSKQQAAVRHGQEEPDKVETVLYVMADKFLESAEMDE